MNTFLKKGMKRKIYSIVTLITTLLFSNLDSVSQGFTNTEYKKALWMTTRMFGAQRSGETNWLVDNHLPSGVDASLRGKIFINDKDPVDNYDLSGGWCDAGDHVMFGQTQFYSAYMLLKGYAEWSKGYGDYYTYNYMKYRSTNQWSWEQGQHDPDGIPDVLQEVKHATDFFIKCARNSTTFYYQKGDGGGSADHATWNTGVKIQTQAVSQGGQPRSIYKNPNDASMPSFAAATLALMSRLYKDYDAAYAQTCSAAAINAYNYAKSKKGFTAPDAGDRGFYSANDNWKDDYATMCAELFWLTNTASYKTEALAFTTCLNGSCDIKPNQYWSFDYDNNEEIAFYNLAKLGDATALSNFNTHITTNYIAKVTNKLYNGGNGSWGTLRYNANAAMLAALYQKLNNNNTVSTFIYDQIDYILGKNSGNQSYVVGFGTKYPLHPHHRNIYLNDANVPEGNRQASISIPTKNLQAGILVGGSRDPSTFQDDVTKYQFTEPAIDYNTCLVGALGFINSVLAPVTIGPTCRTPSLGDDISICGSSSLLLNSGLTSASNRTFSWKKDGNTISGSNSTLSVSTAGVYQVKVDSSNGCSKTSDITVLGTIQTPNLGNDKIICDTTSYNLDARVSGAAITYDWLYSANGATGALVLESTQKGQTWANVRKAGLYRVIAKATGCNSQQDDVTVTSSLPTPQDGCASKAGNTQTIAIVNPGLGSGTYDWYDAATNGNKVGTGSSISVSPSITTTYYVQDASAVSGSVGPKTAFASVQNWGINTGNHLKFNLNSSINISSLKILGDYYVSSGTITVEVLDANGNALNPVRKFVSNNLNFTTNSSGIQLFTVAFSNFFIDKSWGTSLRLRIAEKSANIIFNPNWNNSGATYPYNSSPNGVFTITGTAGGDNDANDYMYFYDIQFNSGSVCGRLPVIASVNPNCITTDLEMTNEINDYISLYPNPSSESFNLATNKAVLVKVYDDLGREVLEFTNQKTSIFGETLNAGLYHVVLFENGKKLKAMNVIKK